MTRTKDKRGRRGRSVVRFVAPSIRIDLGSAIRWVWDGTTDIVRRALTRSTHVEWDDVPVGALVLTPGGSLALRMDSHQGAVVGRVDATGVARCDDWFEPESWRTCHARWACFANPARVLARGVDPDLAGERLARVAQRALRAIGPDGGAK